MSNVMSLKGLKNNPSRNGFDLSKRNIFSAKVGELLPVYCKEVIPGDKFNINVKSFTRTMPVNTAAYTRIKEYYDWFFVPTNLLWNRFNQFITQVNPNSQHAISYKESAQTGDTHPYFTSNSVYNYVNTLKTSNLKNHFGFNRGDLSEKLLDYLGYGDITSSNAENVAMNPFPLLAYQKIYSDYFRNSNWENSYAPAFNIDYFSSNAAQINCANHLQRAREGFYTMFDMRYANWNKDLFMGVLPNPQYGAAASLNLNSINYIEPIKLSSPRVGQQVTTNGSGELSVSEGHQTSWYLDTQSIANLRRMLGLTSSSSIDNLTSTFSVLALRQAEALQRWKEITNANQLDYRAQIEAHFGVSMSDAYAERCKWIDGFSDTIDISEVVNTNLVDGDKQNIADIAGKGVGAQDGYTSFSSDVHGYLICIYHATPVLDYNLPTRCARQILKTKVTDYAIPELDKIGMVQVPLIEMTNNVELKDAIDSKFLGYAPRYYDYKTDVDEIHGSARNRNSAWVAAFDEDYLMSYIKSRLSSTGSFDIIDYSFFKVNPSILDPIFSPQTSADSTTDSDQLLTNCYFDIKCVRNLDYNGLPY